MAVTASLRRIASANNIIVVHRHHCECKPASVREKTYARTGFSIQWNCCILLVSYGRPAKQMRTLYFCPVSFFILLRFFVA